MLRPYILDAIKICSLKRGTSLPEPHALKFLHCPIVDCATTTDEDVYETLL